MKRLLVIAVLAAALISNLSPALSARQASPVYYPAAGEAWEKKRPEDVGMDSALRDAAVGKAKTHASRMPRDFSTQVQPFGSLLGPMPKERGETNGIVIRHGYIVAEWGDTRRIDPTYSVAKSFLSTVLGLTIDRRVIKSIDDHVRKYIRDGGYDSAHNSMITWR